MRIAGAAAALATATALLLLPVAGAAAQISDDVSLSVTPAVTEVVLGESFDVTIEVTNNGTERTPPLVIHIDITDPASASSVDPEDWTSTLTQIFGVVEPDQTGTVTWTLQPISPGAYSVYAVALSPGVDNSAISNIATVRVADQRSLNPGGILPVAIAAPTVIGALLAYRTRRYRGRG